MLRHSFFKLGHMLNICGKGHKVMVTPALYKECTLKDECVTLNLVWLKSLVSTTQMAASPYDYQTYNVRFSHYIQGTLLHPLKMFDYIFFLHIILIIDYDLYIHIGSSAGSCYFPFSSSLFCAQSVLNLLSSSVSIGWVGERCNK